jgi:hypothetical protein
MKKTSWRLLLSISLAVQSYIVTWAIMRLLTVFDNSWNGWMWAGDSFYPTPELLLRACILAPLFEEYVFRRILLGSMLMYWNRSVSLITPSVIFAAAHIQYYSVPMNLIGVLISGFLCGYCYLSFHCIWPGCVLHGLQNCLILSPMTSLYVFLYYRFNSEKAATLLCVTLLIGASIGVFMTFKTMRRESHQTNLAWPTKSAIGIAR